MQPSYLQIESQQVNVRELYYFKPLYYPNSKIQCKFCRKNISRNTIITFHQYEYDKVQYFCASCFSKIQYFPEKYHVLSKLQFPLFQTSWSAQEELLLFQGMEKHGYGNWGQISELMKTGKTSQQIQDHYLSVYLNQKQFNVPLKTISEKTSQGIVINNQNKINFTKNWPKYIRHNVVAQPQVKGSSNNPSNIKSPSTPAQIVGYMPKRGDFQVQYDNDAQFLLAEMQFNDDDTPQQKNMKYRLLQIYNHKLNERIKRKQFVISRKILDNKQQLRLDKTRTRQQKEIHNIMKVFARFNDQQIHDRFVENIIRQKQLRQRVQQLKQMKKKGIKTIGEVEKQLQLKRNKDKKREGQQFSTNKNAIRRGRKQQGNQKTQKRVLYVNREEEQLCRQLNMTFRQYLNIKQTLLKESVKKGIVTKDQASGLFKFDKKVVEATFDFLVESQQIPIARPLGSISELLNA